MARWRGFKNKADACYYCLYFVSELRERGIKMTVDHVVPRFHGGTSDLDNLVTACELCNNAKGSDSGWYEGCVALEGDGDPARYKELLKERANDAQGKIDRTS